MRPQDFPAVRRARNDRDRLKMLALGKSLPSTIVIDQDFRWPKGRAAYLCRLLVKRGLLVRRMQSLYDRTEAGDQAHAAGTLQPRDCRHDH
jgi:hypothetical protein